MPALHCSSVELVAVGAVIAREYGLPCVVNVSSATALFSTGFMMLSVILKHNLNCRSQDTFCAHNVQHCWLV